MSIEFDDRIQNKPPRSRDWTVGRVLNDVAIIMVAVPIGVGLIAAGDRLPTPRGGCGNTTENFCLMLGLSYFAIKLAWMFLKPFNDAFERHLTASDAAARSRYLAEQTASIRKPLPLDDF